jgi:hypothetical protein
MTGKRDRTPIEEKTRKQGFSMAMQTCAPILRAAASRWTGEASNHLLYTYENDQNRANRHPPLGDH